MKNNILKNCILIISVIIIFMSIFACVNAAEDNSDLTMLSLSKGGLVIDYPSNWGYSESTSEYSIMALSKLDSIDSAGIGQVNINFEKKPMEGEFYSYVNDTYKSMQKDSSFELISSGGVMVGTMDAVEYIYTSTDDNGTKKEHKAVWFEKGGQAYVMLYSAPVDKFEDNLYVFDYMLSDIQIT
ncbi:hypothetical protein [Methanobrevibacter sp.]|uniref:hypothetical protein n=1 Tax=Methanobrevibacter sp. TaxID=66852 RepID=UPI003890442F